MGGKKRSKSKDRDSDYSGILKKLKKLENKVKKKSRLRITSTSSESEFNDTDQEEIITGEDYEGWNPEMELNDEDPDVSKNTDENLELEQDILEILGDDPSSNKTFGENLHKDVASRWKHLLQNGLSKENRSDIIKEYLPPENCPFVKAPALNLEIKAALTEINNKKDVYAQSRQNQLGSGLSALGKALNIALKNKPEFQEIIKPLSDAAKLFCDIHYKESLSRRFAAINTLNKQTRDTIKNTKIDNFLFGSELAEHLKSSKAISKSGSELRPQAPATRSVAKTQNTPQAGPSSSARRGALNMRGAPRTAAAGSRAYPPPRSRQPPPPPRDRNSSYKSQPRYRSRRR